jgi:hypothetical protein
MSVAADATAFPDAAGECAKPSSVLLPTSPGVTGGCEAVVSTAAAGSTGSGGVVDGRSDRSLQQPALEQLLSLMDDSQMPIFVSNDEDRYLYELRLAR